ncbi:MAG: hypothetical protein Q4G62_00540 [Pseudomonadota bacterium]|nr:hypothetical protein [Pseudomonadota bacterium]
MRSNALTRLALTMLLVGSSAASTAAEPAIYNVMVAQKLTCSDNPASIATRIHPERATIQTSGKLHVGNTGYWVDFNAIPGYRDWTAVTRFHATDRGVDDNYVLLSRTGMPPFDAAYVSHPGRLVLLCCL